MSQPTLYFASGGLAILIAVGVSRLVGSWAVDLNPPETQHEHVAHSMVSPEPATAITAASNQVTIDNFTFSPQSLVVAAGTTVTWVNRDDIPHTIKDTANVFQSHALDTDDEYSYTFTKAGEYSYFCGIHPHMTAKIVVK